MIAGFFALTARFRFCEDSDLPIPFAFWRFQAEHTYVSEVVRERARAIRKAFNGDHENENSRRNQPARNVRSEKLFHALIAALLALLKVKGRVAIDQTEGFDFASGVQCITLNHHIQHFCGFLCPVGVEFDSVAAANRSMAGHRNERPAFAGTGVENRTCGLENQPLANLFCDRIR
ncbi:MAG TPA: hypothetical protein VE999_05340 [Gemmataceae bacterium]|nr:hypothetical protein [Gemmataceae bacterium]